MPVDTYVHFVIFMLVDVNLMLYQHAGQGTEDSDSKHPLDNRKVMREGADLVQWLDNIYSICLITGG